MGIDYKVLSNREELDFALAHACSEALEMIGLLAEGNAKVEFTSHKYVDPTGNLRNSITHEVDGNDVYIGTNVEYGIYVEMGTGVFYPGGRKTPWVYQDDNGVWHQTNGMAPRPFLKPAVTKGTYLKQYAAALKQALGEE